VCVCVCVCVCVQTLQTEQRSSYAAALRQNNELIQELYDLFDDDLSHEVVMYTLCKCKTLQLQMLTVMWYI